MGRVHRAPLRFRQGGVAQPKDRGVASVIEWQPGESADPPVAGPQELIQLV
jgi:hypothetical protein